MYSKGKGASVPSDSQAREKLALYVYEYLLHVGAQKAAQQFLNEIRWEKNITLGDPPGFLHSWWCVFWDLYCAAPERRDTNEHSNEAKAFHDYGFVNPGYGVNGLHNSAQSPLPPPPHQMPAPDGMPPVNMHSGGYYAQPQYMSRYPGPRGPPVRMPNEFMQSPGPGGGVVGGQMPPMHGLDGRTGHPGMQHMQRPGLRMPVNMPPQQYAMRGPTPNGMVPGPGMPQMSMPGAGPAAAAACRPWPPNAGAGMPYAASSPSSYNIGYGNGSPVGYNGPANGPPGTPLMASPQDSTNSGELYMMSRAGMPQFGDGGAGGGPGVMGALMAADLGPHGHLVNGGEMLESLKGSPPTGATGGGTPMRDDLSSAQAGGGMASGYLPQYEGDPMESNAILKIKETMQEEAKRFESKDPGDYYVN